MHDKNDKWLYHTDLTFMTKTLENNPIPNPQLPKRTRFLELDIHFKYLTLYPLSQSFIFFSSSFDSLSPLSPILVHLL